MTLPPRCPSCGAALTPEAVAEGAASPAIRNSWEALRDQVQPPPSIEQMLTAPPRRGPRWWLPSLLYLAYQANGQNSDRVDDRAEARRVLDEFAARRDELSYAVVEEETDDVIGLTIQPWPLVDERGRLRFPISSDPLQVEVHAPDLTDRLHADRQRWHELGLLQHELVERRIHIGDTYALAVASRPAKWRIVTLRHPGERRRHYLGGLPAGRRAGSVAVPIVDVTWDAREAGKLAHHAAAAGVITDQPDPATAPSAQEAEARYMIGYREQTDPRDVELPPEARA
jgi:hypothetical protein